jgi:hypothetical protein
VLLGAGTLKGIDMMLGLFATIFVALKVIFLLLDVCLFFNLNVMIELLSINTSNSSDVTGPMNLTFYTFL